MVACVLSELGNKSAYGFGISIGLGISVEGDIVAVVAVRRCACGDSA